MLRACVSPRRMGYESVYEPRVAAAATVSGNSLTLEAFAFEGAAIFVV